MVHSRRKSFVEKAKSPKSFRSLDLRELDEKKISQSVNLNIPELDDNKSLRHLSIKKGGVFKITGIPTSLLYP